MPCSTTMATVLSPMFPSVLGWTIQADYGLGVVWADFNNTGWPDIYVANDTLPNFLYRNDGKGKFTEIGLESGTALSETGSEQASMGVALGDYLHNGRPSIYVTNFGDDYSGLY